MNQKESSRRKFLALTASGALAACAGESPESAGGPTRLGKPVSGYGERAQYEKASRLRPNTPTPEEASSLTPLADSHGILTPSALHFERHHSGVPNLDPANHELLVHGLETSTAPASSSMANWSRWNRSPSSSSRTSVTRFSCRNSTRASTSEQQWEARDSDGVS